MNPASLFCSYDMPQPSANERSDLAAWQACVANAQAQLEHQHNRYCAFSLSLAVALVSAFIVLVPPPRLFSIANLELLTSYGGQSWTRHLQELTAMETDYRRQLDETQCVGVGPQKIGARRAAHINSFLSFRFPPPM